MFGKRELVDKSILTLLVIGIYTSMLGFYLFPHGKGNNFPTFVTAIAVVIYLALHSRNLRWIRKSRILIVSCLLLAYLSLSAFWSGEVPLAEVLIGFANALLIIVFMLGILICAGQWERFIIWLIRGIPLAATLSAVCFLARLGILDSESIEPTTPWGRLHAPTIAALSYGIAGVFALCLLLNSRSPAQISIWSLCVICLGASCFVIGIDYVWFGLFTAGLVLVVMSIFEETQRQKRIYFIIPVLMVILVFQFNAFQNVMSSERQIIWQPVIDMIYEGRPVFGNGLLADAKPGINCGSAEITTSDVDNCVVQHPHNIYVATMYYGGLLGLVMLISLLLVSITSVLEYPTNNLNMAILSAMAFSLTVLMFDGDHLVQKIDFIWLVFWLPVSLAAAFPIRYRARSG
jgi:hypothetical protein